MWRNANLLSVTVLLEIFVAGYFAWNKVNSTNVNEISIYYAKWNTYEKNKTPNKSKIFAWNMQSTYLKLFYETMRYLVHCNNG